MAVHLTTHLQMEVVHRDHPQRHQEGGGRSLLHHHHQEVLVAVQVVLGDLVQVVPEDLVQEVRAVMVVMVHLVVLVHPEVAEAVAQGVYPMLQRLVVIPVSSG